MTGYIQDYDGQALTIKAPFQDTFGFIKKKITNIFTKISKIFGSQRE